MYANEGVRGGKECTSIQKRRKKVTKTLSDSQGYIKYLHQFCISKLAFLESRAPVEH